MAKLTSVQKRKNMQANKSTGTRPELMLAKALYARGHRYRKNDRTVLGTPDLTFKKLQLAIFVDGEFWHGKDWHITQHNIKTNREFWINKIERNIQRDQEVNNQLSRQGWTILRFWGMDIIKNLHTCVMRIENVIYQLQLQSIKKISLEKYGNQRFKVTLIDPEQYHKVVRLNPTSDSTTYTYPIHDDIHLPQVAEDQEPWHFHPTTSEKAQDDSK